jgi:uncharacterized protein YkwD
MFFVFHNLENSFILVGNTRKFNNCYYSSKKSMKKIIALAFMAAAFCSFKPAEGYPFEKWDAATLEKANSAKEVAKYTDEEKKVVFYMNLARLNPDLFAKTYYQKYLDSTQTKETSFTRSLKNDLVGKYKPMEVVTVKEDLTDEAVSHAKDTGKKGNMGHFTSDGKSYEFRIKSLKETYKALAEACDYGNDKALNIVMHLLIDEGQATIDHRKSILEKKHLLTGVSIQPHKKEKHTCVIELGTAK